MKSALRSIALGCVSVLACLGTCANAQDAAEPKPLKLPAQKKPLPKFKDYPAGPIFKARRRGRGS